MKTSDVRDGAVNCLTSDNFINGAVNFSPMPVSTPVRDYSPGSTNPKNGPERTEEFFAVFELESRRERKKEREKKQNKE